MLYEVITMAGNPIRCVAKFLYDKGLVKSKIVNIETKSGVKQCKLYTKNSMVYKVESEMGKAVLTPAEIPVALPKHMQTKENETMIMNQEYNVITSYSIHYTKLYERKKDLILRQQVTAR